MAGWSHIRTTSNQFLTSVSARSLWRASRGIRHALEFNAQDNQMNQYLTLTFLLSVCDWPRQVSKVAINLCFVHNVKCCVEWTSDIGGVGSLRQKTQRRKVTRQLLKIEDAPTEDDEPHPRSSTTDVKQTHLKSHQPFTANMVVYYSLPAIGKVGSHYVRQALG